MSTTPPATRPGTIDPEQHEFRPPRKYIRVKEDVTAFERSPAHRDITQYVARLADAVRGVPCSDVGPMRPIIRQLVGLLKALQQLVFDTPTIDAEGSRFGNEAFRTWHSLMEKKIAEITPEFTPRPALKEVNSYLAHSFGHRDRLDYGTGHELNFLLWLLCLDKIGVLGPEDDRAVVFRVFYSYILLMRQLQSTYWLEPAGSHGIWGLDDYQFLPFVFGAAQLDGHPSFRPICIIDNDLVRDNHREYLYLDAIHYINSIKTESLQWHSPMLNDIAGVPYWSKVASGMVKMYKAEVLGKLPVVQHFLFGTLLQFPNAQQVDEQRAREVAEARATLAENAERFGLPDGQVMAQILGPDGQVRQVPLRTPEETETGPDHYHDPDNICCYHRVPSVHAAAAASGGNDLSISDIIIPFD
ncbi:hypothetical protein H696_00670 [Fonticula alba]|uniref:Serine/threonine-protein phosphatase 2A activator n=1 Tax=Fonticula alba TaxID=691883 RepID=A0A058ZFJ2_FONAL|nr:hypothetical protein H696_00670 [Fonticula alba]KCV73124.1 hypothetical protein H696_00670 [Fonticula alba]|eukprot:XP_009492825.1 hypothetical protein H696_00670 [Fonticula alba]